MAQVKEKLRDGIENSCCRASDGRMYSTVIGCFYEHFTLHGTKFQCNQLAVRKKNTMPGGGGTRL